VILELLALASLLRADPAGDAYGAGDLVPPSAAVYADLSSFDLIEVEAGGDDELIVRIRLAGIPDPGRLPNRLTLPVIDVYLDLADGGEEATLPGVGMAFPAGRGWEVALRVHGDRAYHVRADDPARREREVAVARSGDVLTVATGLPAPEEIRDLQAVTGVYDPFSRDAWRPLAVAPSPWAFASEAPAPPVVDLLAEGDEAQRDAIRGYLLPPTRDTRGPVGWLLAMFVGLGLAAAGLWLRRHAPAADSRAEPTGAPTIEPRAEPTAEPAADPPAASATESSSGPDAIGRGAGAAASALEPIDAADLDAADLDVADLDGADLDAADLDAAGAERPAADQDAARTQRPAPSDVVAASVADADADDDAPDPPSDAQEAPDDGSADDDDETRPSRT
jgi:carbohydrate-binding DOMON domain-containing protein